MKVLITELRVLNEEDLEIYAAEPIIEFEHSEQGQWLKEHSYEQMVYDLLQHPEVFGYGVRIYAWLTEQDLTFYKLKWG
jgi:hypothetical protein